MKLKLFDIEISNLPQYQLLSVWHCEMKLIFRSIETIPKVLMR